MNRYRLKYVAGANSEGLPEEILADYYRGGPNTNFFRKRDDRPPDDTVIVHSIASRVIIHIELVEEDVNSGT